MRDIVHGKSPPADHAAEGVQVAMHVFTYVNTTGADAWKNLLHRDALLSRRVSAIVDNDVRCGECAIPKHPPPKQWVGLIADEYVCSGLFVCTTGGFDIDSIDLRRWAEIVSPHVERPARIHTDFNDYEAWPMPQRCEVAVVNVEIVAPFPDAATITPGIKKRFQLIWGRRDWRWCSGSSVSPLCSRVTAALPPAQTPKEIKSRP